MHPPANSCSPRARCRPPVMTAAECGEPAPGVHINGACRTFCAASRTGRAITVEVVKSAPPAGTEEELISNAMRAARQDPPIACAVSTRYTDSFCLGNKYQVVDPVPDSRGGDNPSHYIIR